MGAVLTALPPGARLVRVKGVRYHLHNGVHYRPMIRNGVSVYVVARLCRRANRAACSPPPGLSDRRPVILDLGDV